MCVCVYVCVCVCVCVCVLERERENAIVLFIVCNILIVEHSAVIGEQDRVRQGCGPC